jgi:hypothetical protein
LKRERIGEFANVRFEHARTLAAGQHAEILCAKIDASLAAL